MNKSDSKNGSDLCPTWASDLIKHIKFLELKLGNIQESEEWHVSNIEELSKKISSEDSDEVADSNMIESLFSRITKGLAKEGFAPEQITDFINSRIGPEGRLSYCSIDEVLESLN